MTNNNLQSVYKTNSIIEANYIKTILESKKIPVFLQKEAIGKIFGITIDGIGEINLLTNANLYKKALQIIKNIERGSNMKIFLDTANINEIKKGYEIGVVDGITTNPTLMAKESSKTRDEIIKEIISIVDGPISVEVISQNAHEMVKEGKELHSIAPNNIVIKVPICLEGLKAIKMFEKENISTNCTLIFSLNQAILAIKAGATYVSPFVGRIDDIGEDGMQVVEDIVSFIDDYGFNTQVIAASIRHPLHVSEAAMLGTHIATIPYNILEKMIYNPLTDIGIDKFNKDWDTFEKAKKS